MIKHRLKKLQPNENFKDVLNEFLGQYHCTPHTTTCKSPAELFLGRKLRTSLDLVHEKVSTRVESRQEIMVASGPKKCREFQVGDYIYFETRDPLQPLLSNFTKGIVVERTAPKTYKIMNSADDILFRHEDQIKFRTVPEVRITPILERTPGRGVIRPEDIQSTSNV